MIIRLAMAYQVTICGAKVAASRLVHAIYLIVEPFRPSGVSLCIFEAHRRTWS